jgi:hypothetical protein
MSIRPVDTPSPELAPLCNASLERGADVQCYEMDVDGLDLAEPGKPPTHRYPCQYCDGTGSANRPMVVSFLVDGVEYGKTEYPECKRCNATGREHWLVLGHFGQPRGLVDREEAEARVVC